MSRQRRALTVSLCKNNMNSDRYRDLATLANLKFADLRVQVAHQVPLHWHTRPEFCGPQPAVNKRQPRRPGCCTYHLHGSPLSKSCQFLSSRIETKVLGVGSLLKVLIRKMTRGCWLRTGRREKTVLPRHDTEAPHPPHRREAGHHEEHWIPACVRFFAEGQWRRCKGGAGADAFTPIPVPRWACTRRHSARMPGRPRAKVVEMVRRTPLPRRKNAVNAQVGA